MMTVLRSRASGRKSGTVRLDGLHTRFLFAVGCCCGAAVSVCAQEIPRADVPDGLHADLTYDVYVNDSLEAADAIAKAQALGARRRWSEAAEILQRTQETAGDKLVRVSPGRYVGIRDHINALIARWPDEGINAYRSLFEREMAASLSGPSAVRTAEELLPLFDRYFCTEAAARLADVIGQAAIEAGDLALAKHVYRRVLEHHPDRFSYAPAYGAMLAVVAAMRGEPDADAAKFDEEAKIRWMGQDRVVRDVIAEVSERFSALRAPPLPSEWPIFGGDTSRNRRASTDVHELGLLWRFGAFESRSESLEGDRIEVSIGGERNRGQELSVYPVISRGLVFGQLFRELVALHRNTGAVAWRFRADEAGSGSVSYLEEQPPAWDCVTVHDGRVYASLPGDSIPYYSYESTRTPPELVCLDADTGRVIWRLDQETIKEAFAQVTFDSTPIIQHGRLFVVGRRRRSFGFEDCYLYCFTASTGRLVFRAHVGSASTGTFGSRQATKSIAAMHGDSVYVCTNLGSIAAVAVHTGTVRWLTLYERERDDDDQGFSRFGQHAKPWHFNPVIWSSGRIIVLPTDGGNVSVLDAGDGKLSKSIPVDRLGGLEMILGVKGEILCGVGHEAVCYDLATDSLRWSTPLPEEASLDGRGIWADDRLLVPTRKWLSTFRVSDGKRTDVAWGSEDEGGNILATPDQVLVAGGGRITAYVKKKEIWAALRDRMAAAPADPLPALELAEIALGNREFSEAVSVMDEAVRRAERLGEPMEPAVGRRIFDDVLMFVERLSAHSILDAKLLDKLFVQASQYAPDASAHLLYRFRFAELFQARDQPERAVRLYQQVLRDRSLREMLVDPSAPGSESAGTFAQSRIAGLIAQHGRSVYASHEAEARRWLDSAQATGDEATLQRLALTFPNSEAAPLALTAHGDLLVSRGKPEDAAKCFAKAYHRYPKQVDRPLLLRKIADAYELAGKVQYAYLWLTKAAREHPSVRIEDNGRSVTFREYRERLSHVRDQIEPSRPNIALPFKDQFAKQLGETVLLLVPRFGDLPNSRWSRYFVHTARGIRAFDARTGTDLWSDPAKAKGNVELLLATSDVAVIATLYEIFALDIVTGLRRWSYGELPKHLDRVDADWEDEEIFRTHAIAGNRLVSVSDAGKMNCVLIDSGRLMWSKAHRPEPVGRVRLAGPWVVYHVIQDDQAVLCLVDAATGTWIDGIVTDETRPVEDFFVTLEGQLILVTSQSIASYDPDLRRRRWRIAPGGYIRPPSLLLDLDVLYFSSDGRKVQKISLEDGHQLWESERLAGRGDDDLTVQREGNSIIVSTASSVGAVDAVTGLTLWRGATPQHPRFITRLLTRSYVVAVDVPNGFAEAESIAYFYDHRNASGLIPPDGGALKLGSFSDVRAVMAVDGALLIQAGTTIQGWSGK